MDYQRMIIVYSMIAIAISNARKEVKVHGGILPALKYAADHLEEKALKVISP